MKAKVLIQNDIVRFKSIPVLKTFLNEMLYYHSEVKLYCEGSDEVFNYSETNDLRRLLSECKFYNKPLEIYPIL